MSNHPALFIIIAMLTVIVFFIGIAILKAGKDDDFDENSYS
jgi:hypothetical protein